MPLAVSGLYCLCSWHKCYNSLACILRCATVPCGQVALSTTHVKVKTTTLLQRHRTKWTQRRKWKTGGVPSAAVAVAILPQINPQKENMFVMIYFNIISFSFFFLFSHFTFGSASLSPFAKHD